MRSLPKLRIQVAVDAEVCKDVPLSAQEGASKGTDGRQRVATGGLGDSCEAGDHVQVNPFVSFVFCPQH